MCIFRESKVVMRGLASPRRGDDQRKEKRRDGSVKRRRRKKGKRKGRRRKKRRSRKRWKRECVQSVFNKKVRAAIEGNP